MGAVGGGFSFVECSSSNSYCSVGEERIDEKLKKCTNAEELLKILWVYAEDNDTKVVGKIICNGEFFRKIPVDSLGDILVRMAELGNLEMVRLFFKFNFFNEIDVLHLRLAFYKALIRVRAENNDNETTRNDERIRNEKIIRTINESRRFGEIKFSEVIESLKKEAERSKAAADSEITIDDLNEILVFLTTLKNLEGVDFCAFFKGVNAECLKRIFYRALMNENRQIIKALVENERLDFAFVIDSLKGVICEVNLDIVKIILPPKKLRKEIQKNDNVIGLLGALFAAAARAQRSDIICVFLTSEYESLLDVIPFSYKQIAMRCIKNPNISRDIGDSFPPGSCCPS